MRTVTVYCDLCFVAWLQQAVTESSHAPKRNPCFVAKLQRVVAKGSCMCVIAVVLAVWMWLAEHMFAIMFAIVVIMC